MRRAEMTWSCACSTVAESAGMTITPIHPLNQSATWVNVVCGTITIGVLLSPNRLCASAYTPTTVKGMPNTLMRLPMASSPGNSDDAVFSLMTQTSAPAANSSSVQLRPVEIVPPETSGQLVL